MGNKGSKHQTYKRKPYSLAIEFAQQIVNPGDSIVGQATLLLEDVYDSEGGLDKCVVTLTGTERVRYCEQKKDNPKKIKNKNLVINQKVLFTESLNIHDFMGYKRLNGGRYNLPFSILAPLDAAPSLEVSPVEMSMFEVAWYISV